MTLDLTFSVPFTHRLRVTRDAFAPTNDVLADILRNGGTKPARVAFFVDDGVLKCFPDLPHRIERYARAHRDRIRLAAPVTSVPGGEACKNDPEFLNPILGTIHEAALCRQSYVVAIGGGAVLDIVGFAAAIAHRSVRLVRFPTTTLSQCDSGVGVKNGINAFAKKNYIGSFTVPWAVINDVRFLESLSDRDWLCGFSEALKVSLVKDRTLYERMLTDRCGIARREYRAAGRILARSAELHLRHIAEGGDPFELTTARPLDFGHWAAHKLEQMTDFRLRHGEAVAIGIAVDVCYSASVGLLDDDAAEAIVDYLERLGLPVWDDAMRDTETLLAGLEEFREHLGGELTVTLLNGIGRGVDVHEIDTAVMAEAIRSLADRQAEVAAGCGPQIPTEVDEMSEQATTCPLSREQVIDRYFLEHRAKLIDIAAFLDRIDRATPAGDASREDFRVAAFRTALALLDDGRGSRARRVLEAFSDPTEQPLESAAGLKGAHGAWPGRGGEGTGR